LCQCSKGDPKIKCAFFLNRIVRNRAADSARQQHSSAVNGRSPVTNQYVQQPQQLHSHYHHHLHDGNELGDLIQPVSPDGNADQVVAYGANLPGLYSMHAMSNQSPSGPQQQQQTHVTALYQPVGDGGKIYKPFFL
jgi:hypothetical protein